MTALVVHLRPTSRHGLVVLVGAVEADPRTRHLPVDIAFSLEGAMVAAREALAAGRRPLVAWSFTSAGLREVATELAAFRAGVPDPRVLQVAGGAHPSADPVGTLRAGRFRQTPFLFKARWRHRSLPVIRGGVAAMAARGARDLRFLTPSALSYGAVGEEASVEAVEALLATSAGALGPGGRILFGTFPSELRPEHVTAPALAVVRRYAFNRSLILGGQSGSDRMLAAMGRGHDAAAVERAARLALEAGFLPSVDLFFGLPGEAEEDLEATRSLAARLAGAGARVHAHAFLPLPGTPWAGAAPARIDAAARRLLDRLASSGRAHGSWKRQETLVDTQE